MKKALCLCLLFLCIVGTVRPVRAEREESGSRGIEIVRTEKRATAIMRENEGERQMWNMPSFRIRTFSKAPISDEIFERIRGKSYPMDDTKEQIRRSDLNYLRLWYVDFDGNEQLGEMICHQDIADDVVDIFYDLYLIQYPIECMRLIDDFDANDGRSMEANNTSSFCYRYIGDTDMLSNHAMGRAVDINPLYNPQVVLDEDTKELLYVDPAKGAIYADRSKAFPHKIFEEDPAYKLFMQHGFIWGGVWEDENDYMHFEKPVEEED